MNDIDVVKRLKVCRYVDSGKGFSAYSSPVRIEGEQFFFYTGRECLGLLPKSCTASQEFTSGLLVREEDIVLTSDPDECGDYGIQRTGLLNRRGFIRDSNLQQLYRFVLDLEELHLYPSIDLFDDNSRDGRILTFSRVKPCEKKYALSTPIELLLSI